MSLFSNVRIWRDNTARTPAGQMALDEAVLRTVASKSDASVELRFYLLPSSCVTIGFFMPFGEAIVAGSHVFETSESCLSIVRRLTGGGIVFHGNDVTFSLSVGKAHEISSVGTAERYHVVHEALRDSLVQSGVYPEAELIPISSTDPEKGDLACFSKPVGWDILDRKGGNKIAGGAQRRSNGSWLHQGTVQIPAARSILADWTQIFAEKLGAVTLNEGDECIEIAARDLEKSRYSTPEWNERV